MTAIVRRFSRDDRASIAHALMHLETNKIADDDYPSHSGWYCGNREQFVKRHKKAVALMRSLLTPNALPHGTAVAGTRPAASATDVGIQNQEASNGQAV